MKRFINIGRDEEAEKYGCDGRVAFDLVFGEPHHYLMTMERLPYNYGSIIHSGITQLVLPHTPKPNTSHKKYAQLVG